MAFLNPLLIGIAILCLVAIPSALYIFWPSNKEKLTLQDNCPSPINVPLTNIEKPSACACKSQNKYANPALAVSGTGVGDPAFEGQNEFPAPFKGGSCKKTTMCSNDTFNPSPSDTGRDEDFENITYDVNPPPTPGTICERSSGVGEPALPKKNEFPAPYSTSGK